MGTVAAIVGATAFSISGYFSLYSNNGFVRTYMYLPLLCLLVEWVVRTRRLLAVAALGLGTAGCIVVGMPESATFVILLAVGFGGYRLFRGDQARTRGGTAGALASAFAFGLALAMPLLMLFAQYERLSFNVHKGASGVGLQTDPAQWLLNWLAPFWNGEPNSSAVYPGVMSGTRNWIGGAVFALVLIGVASRTRAARLVMPFFGGVAVLLIAKAYGFPLLDWVGHLPVADRANLPAFGLPCAGFALALAAAAVSTGSGSGCSIAVGSRRAWPVAWR